MTVWEAQGQGPFGVLASSHDECTTVVFGPFSRDAAIDFIAKAEVDYMDTDEVFTLVDFQSPEQYEPLEEEG